MMYSIIKIDRNPDCHEQEQRTRKNNSEGYPCWICGRAVTNPKYWLHIHEGGAVAVTKEAAKTLDPRGDMGFYPIGANCLKKHPELKPFVEDAAQDQGGEE